MYILIDNVLARKFSKILSKSVHWFTRKVQKYISNFSKEFADCWCMVIVTGDTATYLNSRLLSIFFGKIRASMIWRMLSTDHSCLCIVNLSLNHCLTLSSSLLQAMCFCCCCYKKGVWRNKIVALPRKNTV